VTPRVLAHLTLVAWLCWPWIEHAILSWGERSCDQADRNGDWTRRDTIVVCRPATRVAHHVESDSQLVQADNYVGGEG
jgi:hypothetical protein